MEKGHVGRPTNEEVAARKRKQILKIAIPVFAIVAIIGVIASNNGLNGLMGNGTCQLTCEDGWSLDGTVCYQENVATSEINAYLVGDVVNENGDLTPDGKVTLQDIGVIKNAIENNESLTEEQKLVYDLNGDGNVNESDVSSYSTSTSGEYNYSPKYVCPKQTVDEKMSNGTTNVAATKTITTVDYTLNGTKCSVNTKTRIEKKAVCKENSDSKINPDNKIENNEVEKNSSNDHVDIDFDIQDKTCNKFTCGIINEVNKKSEYDMNYDEDAVGNDDHDEDISFTSKKSNLLNYSVNSDSNYKLNVISQESNRQAEDDKGNLVNVYIPPNRIEYTVYNNIDDCHNGVNGKSFSTNDGNFTTLEIINELKSSRAKVRPIFKEINLIPNDPNVNLNGMSFYIKQTQISDSYEINKECKKFTLGDTKEVVFKNKNNGSRFNLKFNNSNAGGNNNYIVSGPSNKRIKLSLTDNVIIVNNIKSNSFKFVGWSIKLSNDSDYLYDKSFDSLYGEKGPKIVMKSGANLDKFLNNETISNNVILKTEVRKQTKIKVELIGARCENWHNDKPLRCSHKIKFPRDSKVRIYNNLDQCKADEIKMYQSYEKGALPSYQRARAQTVNTKGQYGWIKKEKIINGSGTIVANLNTAKNYYLLISSSKYYYDGYDNCVKVNTNTDLVKAKLQRRYNTIYYDEGKGNVSGDMNSTSKLVDGKVKLRKNTYKRKNYKFSHWIVIRKIRKGSSNKHAIECRGFASKSDMKNKIYSWTSISNCEKYGYKKYKDQAVVSFNAPRQSFVHLVAQWTK